MKVTHSYLFKCNMSEKDIVKWIPNSIYKDMLKHWSKKNFNQPDNVNEILAQNIWYNSNLKKNSKWLFNRPMYQSGVHKLIDLFDLDTGKFMPYQDFITLYPDATDFVSYYGIISTIPKSWLAVLTQNLPSGATQMEWSTQFNDLVKKGKISKIMYNHFHNETAADNDTLRILWNNDLRLKLDLKQFQKIFLAINKITSSTKLRFFQYRILVRALTLNIHVAKWNSEVSPLCTFCDTSNETTIHIFAECVNIKTLWLALKKWCKYIYGISIQLTTKDIILNNFKGPHRELVNMFILLTKFYIYRCRVQKTKPNFSNLMVEINKIKSTEKITANMTGKTKQFEYKWVQYN